MGHKPNSAGLAGAIVQIEDINFDRNEHVTDRWRGQNVAKSEVRQVDILWMLIAIRTRPTCLDLQRG
jgi:hypothetical protein